MFNQSFVYFDPRIFHCQRQAPLPPNTPEGFSYDDQVRLRDTFKKLSDAGAYVMLSNSSSFIGRGLYRILISIMLKLPELMEQNLRVEKNFWNYSHKLRKITNINYGGVLMTKPYYNKDKMILVHADTFKLLSKMKPESMDMIFAWSSIFLSNGGISNSGGQVVSVDKGDWDKISSLRKSTNSIVKWIRLAKEVLKPNGTIWISGEFT